MPVLTLSEAQLSWGDLPVLDKADFSLQEGERVGLIGRNGTGKTSLLKVLSRLVPLDEGELRIVTGTRCILVEQEPILPTAPTLLESLYLRAGSLFKGDEPTLFSEKALLNAYMDKFGVDGAVHPESASGGEKKRAALALAFALKPDLLLLDEPTNHLDIETIGVLETLVQEEFRGARSLVVVTHDRAFLDAVATRIAELDRGMLRSYEGNFQAYEKTKETELYAEALQRRRFDKFWAQEEVWIRKGIEARRTRNEGRVRRLEQLRREREARRDALSSVRLSLDAGERSGKVVIETKALTKSFDGRPIVKSLDLRVMRGDKLGLLGKNGTGKTTLIKLILGKLQADSGTVKLGTNLSVAYFDQLREQLDLNQTVAQTISPGSDWVEIAGVKKHIMSYLNDFLFSPQKANVRISTLSGGERNRLLLARLFALPANLLVLDEPTNDLDIDTLELLEQTLADYTGTVLLVSHDRRFLDNVVTQTLAPTHYDNPDGTWREYVGGYEDWVRATKSERLVATKPPKEAPPVKPKRVRNTATQRVRLSYKEAQELTSLPAHIEALEAEQANLTAKLSDPEYHKRPLDEIKRDKERMDELPSLVDKAYERWEALTQKDELSKGLSPGAS
ncbi:MAG: ATP-binding cassette domain-containing protein [Sutterella sp.]|nr:ATP-binding cassette domain-containing protein [Sutterella sp.]MDD7427790.1 ATP-binding cassette domain-containing protein [Sutterella sp.]MDY3272933.1 ATP-binding cassette domain-containing protein [Duodenibacillus sp.]